MMYALFVLFRMYIIVSPPSQRKEGGREGREEGRRKELKSSVLSSAKCLHAPTGNTSLQKKTSLSFYIFRSTSFVRPHSLQVVFEILLLRYPLSRWHTIYSLLRLLFLHVPSNVPIFGARSSPPPPLPLVPWMRCKKNRRTVEAVVLRGSILLLPSDELPNGVVEFYCLFFRSFVSLPNNNAQPSKVAWME